MTLDYALTVESKNIIRENFPTPLIEDHLDRLQGKRIYNSLNLKNGFHHVKMAESLIKYISFVISMGQYEYLRMTFGFTNIPRVFQRYTHHIFRSMIIQKKLIWMIY